jgi:hypothetical protein
MTEQELVEYFNEHILYELLMLRYAKLRLTEGQTQILWNSLFATFNVDARNLYEFLNNKGTNNEVNVHDYKDYYGAFGRSGISEITGTLQLINEQCFHLGKKRAMAVPRKVNIARIETLFDWAEKNMAELISNFEEDFRKKLTVERADPTPLPNVITTGPTGYVERPQATNHVFSVGDGSKA